MPRQGKGRVNKKPTANREKRQQDLNRFVHIRNNHGYDTRTKYIGGMLIDDQWDAKNGQYSSESDDSYSPPYDFESMDEGNGDDQVVPKGNPVVPKGDQAVPDGGLPEQEARNAGMVERALNPNIPVYEDHGKYHFAIHLEAYQHLKMGEDFDFTMVIMRNNKQTGWLHTLARHYSDFKCSMRELEPFIKKNFPPEFEKLLVDAWKDQDKENAFWTEYDRITTGENAMRYKKASAELQLNMYNFVKGHIQYDNFRVSINDDGTDHFQCHFKMKDIHGGDTVMLLGTYMPAYAAELRFKDLRLVYFINTIYFNDVEEANRKIERTKRDYPHLFAQP